MIAAATAEEVLVDQPVAEQEAKADVEVKYKKRKRSAPPVSYLSQIDGKPVVLYRGTSVVEDPRWIQILEVKENGTKRYRCPGCGHEFTGKEGRVIIHKLRKGGDVKPCAQLPSPECRTVLERVDGVKATARAAIYRASDRGHQLDYRRFPEPPDWALRASGLYCAKMLSSTQNIINMADPSSAPAMAGVAGMPGMPGVPSSMQGLPSSTYGVPGALSYAMFGHNGGLQWGSSSMPPYVPSIAASNAAAQIAAAQMQQLVGTPYAQALSAAPAPVRLPVPEAPATSLAPPGPPKDLSLLMKVVGQMRCEASSIA